MQEPYRLRNIKRTVYRLKRSFGTPLRIITQDSITTNFETGLISESKSVVQLRQAIVLTATQLQEVKYDIGFLKANSNFVYGGFYNDSNRRVIIYRDDLPNDYVIEAKETQYIVYHKQRYEIKQVGIDEHAYFLVIEKLMGAPVGDVHEINIKEPFYFDEYLSSTPGVQVHYTPMSDDLSLSEAVNDSDADTVDYLDFFENLGVIHRER